MSKRKKIPSLPLTVPRSYEPFFVDEPGWWLIFGDLHIPYHEPSVVEAILKEGKKNKARGLIIIGDLLDYHEISTFDKDPTKPRYIEERQAGLAFFEYLRYHFPKSSIIYKSGNHEERLERYIMRRAPALFGLDVLSINSLMELSRFGVDHVGDKRVVKLNKLNLLHGHEYTEKSITSPVNPARGLFLRTKGTAACGHFHQTSEHHEPTIAGKSQGCWSIGCSCQLAPPYRPLNKWNHGAALVKVDNTGFSVRNFRIIDGKVV